MSIYSTRKRTFHFLLRYREQTLTNKIAIDHTVIYVASHSGSPTGPFAWVARTITPEGFSELSGHSEAKLFRSQIIAAIEALSALPNGSTAHVVCSDPYLIDQVLGRLDKVLAGEVKGWKKLANLDLFPALREARDRHTEVTAEVVPWLSRDAEHDAAVASARRIVDQIIAAGEEGKPVASPILRRAAAKSQKQVREEEQATEDQADAGAHVVRSAAPTISQGHSLDVPW